MCIRRYISMSVCIKQFRLIRVDLFTNLSMKVIINKLGHWIEARASSKYIFCLFSEESDGTTSTIYQIRSGAVFIF